MAHIIEAGREEEKPPKEDDAVIPKLMGQLLDKLSGDQSATMCQLFHKYEDIFSKNECDVGRTQLVEYHIDTDDHWRI